MVAPREIQNVEDLREFLRRFVLGRRVRIYLFGSRARGDSTETSDVDLALEGPPEEVRRLLVELSEICEESCLPQKVDLVDLNLVEESFRQRVRKEGILWAP
ncbi:nucleotidyltransferase domain-containing protein [Thermosulfurimonas marina]|uniref:Nucleotidyltransferase domain-containing protein n=1 Tax=Thermosulfurimonas marina TaxID=2047767 RepID=A0A6H1WQE1_9BACT|nr:nucleotidyltransferase domain-containing protein [Thermosulfurimonas marina]QJA05356.1 nucleotidyltransferase domain-containing protein [Thermosulfurimonas marina]